MSVLGIDVGTSTCKGVVLTADGKIINKNQYNYSSKPTIEKNTAYISAQVFKDGVFNLIRELALAVKDVDPIEALALSTHGETLILADGDGNALSPAILSTMVKNSPASVGDAVNAGLISG